MKILQVIFCLFMAMVLQAQVRTIVIKKIEPYDTQHVTLAFGKDFAVMPQFNGGKKNYDLAVQGAYENLLGKNSKPKLLVRTNDIVEMDTSTLYDTTSIKYYEGRPLDKARFIQVKTFCDTGGNILILPQEIPDDYTMMAIAMVRQLPKFMPASSDGEAVPVYLTIPIRFLNRITNDPKIRDKPGFASPVKRPCFFMRWIRRIFHFRVNGKNY